MHKKVLSFLFFAFISILFCVGQAPLEDTRSERQKRIDVFKFGLESDILQLLQTIQDEKTHEYDNEIRTLFETTRSISIRESVISLYTRNKQMLPEQWMFQILEDPWDSPKTTVRLILTHVYELEIRSAASYIRNLLAEDNSDFRDQLIQTIGKIGDSTDAAFLVDYLDSDFDVDDKTRLVIRQNIMTALGELGALETWDRLHEIASDEDENPFIRATAATSLSSMKKADILPLLENLFENKDPLLRSAAITGASNFTDSVARSLIIEGLRDNYYKVRLEALSAVEKLMLADAEPSILYRAQFDPVDSVKAKAYEVLGAIKTESAHKWLLDTFNADATSDRYKVKAADVLMKHNSRLIVDSFARMVDSSLKDDKKKWLRYELGKIMLNTPDTDYEDIALAYLMNSDVSTRGIGLELFNKFRYESLRGEVEKISEDKKQGGLYTRARRILDK